MPATAAFDFDGTLSRRDTFLPFLAAVGGRTRLARALTVGSATTAAFRGARRDDLKAALCRAVLTGRTHDDLRAVGAQFAGYVLARGLRTDRLARVEWHQAEGHRTVIVSASMDLYLEPIAEALGFDAVLCTRLAWADGIATGELDGPNCRGPVKARRLRAWLDETCADGPLWAYGNSRGDEELLAMADHPIWVGRRMLTARPAS